ncbi:MAG: hypothetical protein V1912_08730 [bacterium]
MDRDEDHVGEGTGQEAETWPAEDRSAIREDLRAEEALRKKIEELEREVKELEEARARRNALLGGERPSPPSEPS